VDERNQKAGTMARQSKIERYGARIMRKIAKKGIIIEVMERGKIQIMTPCQGTTARAMRRHHLRTA
jgi:hypothetical protein